MIKTLLFFCISLLAAGYSLGRVGRIHYAVQPRQSEEVLYLPSGRALKLIGFGYDNVLAHTLWFNTISYFGKHYRSDRNYQWLNHMCKLVYTLNPKMHHVYEFCSLMLAWEAQLPEESIAALTMAIEEFPKDWKFRYLRGMTYLVFLKDTQRAASDFMESARLPGAHDIIKRLAAKQLTASESNEAAITFLEEMIENSEQEWERNALIQKLRELKAKQAQSIAVQ